MSDTRPLREVLAEYEEAAREFDPDDMPEDLELAVLCKRRIEDLEAELQRFLDASFGTGPSRSDWDRARAVLEGKRR